MARPTKLTPELSDQIVDALKDGAYVETAAEAAGIDDSTLYRWLDWGAEGKEPYAAFCEAVIRARAEAELDMLRTIRGGDEAGVGFGPAKAAFHLLERTRPNKYAQRVNLRIEDAVREVLEIVRGVCSSEDFARILARLERVDREGGEAAGSTDPGEESRLPH